MAPRIKNISGIKHPEVKTGLRQLPNALSTKNGRIDGVFSDTAVVNSG